MTTVKEQFVANRQRQTTNDQRLTTNDQRPSTPTARETAHRPERTAEYHPRRTSESQSVPRPCQRQIQKLLQDRNLQTHTHSDRPCRSPAVQSNRWPCSCGTERRRARPCHRRKCH